MDAVHRRPPPASLDFLARRHSALPRLSRPCIALPLFTVHIAIPGHPNRLDQTLAFLVSLGPAAGGSYGLLIMTEHQYYLGVRLERAVPRFS